MTELPDFLRGVALIGKYGANYLPVAVDPSGQLYIVLTGAPEITIPGTVTIEGSVDAAIPGGVDATVVNTVQSNDVNTLKQIQGVDGAVFRTAKVDASGQFIMVPRGSSGNYMSVDASGFLTAILKGLKPDASLGTIAADASGQLIMVPRGASGNYMSVDATGFLTAILKGQEGANLRTIAVDASGRMVGLIANVNAAWGYTQNMNLADLAAALGTLQRWDRRGQPLEITDFENGIPSQIYHTQSGAEDFRLNATRALRGGYCLEAQTAPAAGSWIEFTQEFRTVPASRFGAEVAIGLGSNVLYIYFGMDFYTGTTRYRAIAVWSPATTELKYLNSAGAEITLSNAAKLGAGVYVFNHMKVVADFSALKYMRIMLNELSFSIPTQGLYSEASALAPHLTFSIRVGSSSVGTYFAYIDDWIITAEEPV